MALNGEHRLATQAGEAGFYAKVAVSIDVVGDGEKFEVMYADDLPQEWKHAVQFGLAYAREHAKEPKPAWRGMIVRVTHVKWHLVDTTMMAMAYAAARAFWDALGCDAPPGFVLDAETRIFMVPR